MNKGCLAIILGETTGVIGGVGMSTAINGCLNTVAEQRLEKYVDKEVQRPIVDNDSKRRAERIVQFKEIHRKVKNSWDYFDQQFPLLDVVSFYEDPNSIVVASVLYQKTSFHIRKYPTLELRVNFTNMQPRIKPDDLVHEMAHGWHALLPEKAEFENKWREIAGDGYTNNSSLSEPDCLTPMRNVAAVRCYGATNISEDIATIVEEVYYLKTEQDFMTEEAPRIKDKIELAAEYDFFSERERDNALGKITKVYSVQLAENKNGVYLATSNHRKCSVSKSSKEK